jgi:hypothetical protein
LNYSDKGGFVEISPTILPQKTEGSEEEIFCIWGGFVDIFSILIKFRAASAKFLPD